MPSRSNQNRIFTQITRGLLYFWFQYWFQDQAIVYVVSRPLCTHIFFEVNPPSSKDCATILLQNDGIETKLQHLLFFFVATDSFV